MRFQQAVARDGLQPIENGAVGFKRMNETRYIAVVLLLACLASGCTTGRIADLRDCGQLSIGYGLGLEATAKLGCLMHPSVGVVGSSTRRVGNESRHLPCVWEEQQGVWPFLLVLTDMGIACGGGPSYARRCHGHNRGSCYFETVWFPLLGRDSNSHPFPNYHPNYHRFPFHELTNMEVGATLGVIAVRAGINPMEILDFFLGCIGLDIAKDDPKEEKKPTTGLTVSPSASASGGQ